jgi:surfactin synthase thioesterase subunit
MPILLQVTKNGPVASGQVAMWRGSISQKQMHALVGDHFYIRGTTVEYAILVALYEAMNEVGKTQCSNSFVNIYYSRRAFLISVPF